MIYELHRFLLTQLNDCQTYFDIFAHEKMVSLVSLVSCVSDVSLIPEAQYPIPC